MFHKSATRPTPKAPLITRRAGRREQILDAAMALLEREGFAALTVTRLAAELGQSLGALYRHFPGKAGLLVALQLRGIGGLRREVDAALAAERKRLVSKRAPARVAALALVLAALRPFVEGWRRDPTRHRLLDGLLSAPDLLLEDHELREVNAALAPLLEAVAAALEAAVSVGALEPGDGELRARVLWAALHGLDHLRKRDRGEPKRLRSPALAAATLEALLRGFGARPGELTAARAASA